VAASKARRASITSKSGETCAPALQFRLFGTSPTISTLAHRQRRKNQFRMSFGRLATRTRTDLTMGTYPSVPGSIGNLWKSEGSMKNCHGSLSDRAEALADRIEYLLSTKNILKPLPYIRAAELKYTP